MTSLLILNAEIINENKRNFQDIFIQNGRIEQIDSDLSTKQADKIIDASHKIIIPGMIDDQVHFREPGLLNKGSIYTESRAAVAGGTTSFMEMPNVNPATLDSEQLQNKKNIAQKKSAANYAFYLGASNDNLEAIKSLNPNDACGIKVFMGASTGNMLVDDPKILEQIFANAPTLVATHCEDTPTILKNEAIFTEKYGEDIPIRFHPDIRSEEACYLSSSFAVSLAQKHGTKLHVLHITTAKELELFNSARHQDKQITAEVCVHHLSFDQTDYDTLGTQIKCNPAIKTQYDRQALMQAVLDNKLDIIATDHAPHTWQEKQNTYLKAPSGLPLVQHALQMLLEFSVQQKMPLETVVNKTSHAVADIFQIKERGYIREGYWADLTIVNPNQPHIVKQDELFYQCGWSPLTGKTFSHSIDSTIVSGQLAYHQGKILDNIKGQPLEFNR
ncbi:MAG: dihydroorotase [Methylococcales bacterium]|jgi:dihydroorotase|nr:dihydroorotase [Methylococcales bacterium]MBT7408901.1 dihydroorotase [Methylococcales bacterium]